MKTLTTTITTCLMAGIMPMTVTAAPTRVISAVEFTATPAPGNDADMLRTHTSSQALVRYADGTSAEFPLAYHVLFKNTDKVAGNTNEAGRLYDVDGKALVDPNGDAVIAETPDSNSLLNVDGKLFLITHYEYDWLLANGQEPDKLGGWHARMPMSMTLTGIGQDADSGALSAISQKPVDFSSVGGLWIPCFGSQTPWNTHLGSEEDYDLYFTKASGEKLANTSSGGLKSMTDVYFKGKKQANPYQYGYLTEVAVDRSGSIKVTKHYNLGRATWEMGKIMPDGKTVYFGDDGDHVALFMFVADKANDLSSGNLYAARWQQKSAVNGGSASLGWIKLGHADHQQVKQIIDSGRTFEDIFDYTTPEQKPDWEKSGFSRIRAGHSGDEYLRLKKGQELAAAFLESRRYAALLGATTEFNKMEGVAVDGRDKKVYVAMSYVEKGMAQEEGAAADHIQLPKVKAGATYAIDLKGGQKDQKGQAIPSNWVGVAMSVPEGLLGEDMAVDTLGNTAAVNKVANPDNVFFSEKMRTLFIGEDSGTHVNNFVWAYQPESRKLVRILSNASGAESTGLQVVDNLNGHAYVMSNQQHAGEWLKSMPEELRKRLTDRAVQQAGVNKHGVPNYYLEAGIGYLGGLPGL